jgi:6-phosphogluconolactonase (cycloisomerase 2 family)
MWNPSRRTVLGALAATASAPFLGGFAPAAAGTTSELLYVSTWKGTSIYGYRFDAAAGTFNPLGPVATVQSNWASLHPSAPVLYVGGGEDGGVVHAFKVNRSTGALTEAGSIKTDSGGTAGGGISYLEVHANTLLIANFEAGLAASLPLRRDGLLGSTLSTVMDVGSGPNPRQAAPHPHHIVVTPSGKHALVPDFGADKVFIYGFDPGSGALSAARGSYALPAGSGPRRLLFHPDGRTAYLLSELSADLQVVEWSPRAPSLTLRQTISTDSAGFQGTKSAAELAVSRDGRFVYASSRGENALVVFAVDPATRMLSVVQRISCAGNVPWSFTIHRSGRWLLVANELSNAVNLFSIDPSTGTLANTGRSIAVPNPDCLTFA